MFVVLHTTCMYHHCVCMYVVLCLWMKAVGGSSVDLYIHKWRPTNTAVTDVISCNLNTTQRTEWIRSSSRRKDSIPATLNKSDVLKKPTVLWNVEAHLSGKAAICPTPRCLMVMYVYVCHVSVCIHYCQTSKGPHKEKCSYEKQIMNEWMKLIQQKLFISFHNVNHSLCI